MDRRTVLKSVGATAIGLSLAGCTGDTGNGDGTTTEEDDDPLEAIEEEVVDEEMADFLEITESSLYRTADGFGIMGTVRNTGDELVTNVEVHAELHDPDEVIGEFVDDFGEENELNEISAGRAINFDIGFEDTEPQEVQEAVRYEIWATGEIE